MNKSCEFCVWWHRGTASHPGLIATLKPLNDYEDGVMISDYGQCRRMPPFVTAREIERKRGKPMLITITEFPDVPKTAFCGEWGERPAAPEDAGLRDTENPK